jgi:hypothetical protein
MAAPINLSVVLATIALNTALTPEIDLGAGRIVGILMPAAWDAAVMTFQASPDGGTTWGELVDKTGSALSFTVAAGTFIYLDPTIFIGINALKIRSGTSGAAVNQTAARTFQLITRVPD